MGMYDTVEFACPACDELLDVQTKTGDCCLDTWPYYKVPADAATGLIGNIVKCETCGNVFEIVGDIPRVQLILRRYKQGD